MLRNTRNRCADRTSATSEIWSRWSTVVKLDWKVGRDRAFSAVSSPHNSLLSFFRSFGETAATSGAGRIGRTSGRAFVRTPPSIYHLLQAWIGQLWGTSLSQGLGLTVKMSKDDRWDASCGSGHSAVIKALPKKIHVVCTVPCENKIEEWLESHSGIRQCE